MYRPTTVKAMTRWKPPFLFFTRKEIHVLYDNLYVLRAAEDSLGLKFIKFVLKKVNLDSRVLRDTPFALGRFDRTRVHDAFDWTSGTIVARDARIKDHLEFSWE